jgi:hypothetical protein
MKTLQHSLFATGLLRVTNLTTACMQSEATTIPVDAIVADQALTAANLTVEVVDLEASHPGNRQCAPAPPPTNSQPVGIIAINAGWEKGLHYLWTSSPKPHLDVFSPRIRGSAGSQTRWVSARRCSPGMTATPWNGGHN